MPHSTVPAPTDRPPRHRPTLGISASYDVAPGVTVTTDAELATVQFGTGASLRLVGPVDDVTHLIAEAHRQLLLLGRRAATAMGGE